MGAVSVIVGQGKSLMIAVLTMCALLIAAILLLTGLAMRDRVQRYWSERHVLEALAAGSGTSPTMPDFRRPKPLTGPGAWFGMDDYPPDAVRAGEEGRVRVNVAINSKGRPIGCHVVVSSGHPDLDQGTCAVMMKKGRFRAATDAADQPIPAIWEGPGIVWKLSE